MKKGLIFFAVITILATCANVASAYKPAAQEYALDRMDGLYEYAWIDSHGRKCTAVLSTGGEPGSNNVALDCD